VNFLKAIGIDAALKGFIIFFAYGFITTSYIHFRYGFEQNIPESVVATIEGPLSIYTFCWLALVGIALLFWSTNIGRTVCDFENSKPKCVFYFSLPICEAAIALGVVIGATLLGVAASASTLYFIGLTDVNLHSMFFGLALFMLLITYPVIYFTISLIDSEDIVKNKLNITALIYIFISALVLFQVPSNTSSVEIGVVMSSLIITFFILRKWVIKP